MVKTAIHHGQQLKYLANHSTLKSISSLALLMNVSHTAIYNFFKKEELDGKTIEKICRIFSVSPEEFTRKKLDGVLYTVKYEPIAADSNDEIKMLLEENSALKSQLLEAKDEIIALHKQLTKKK
jgi:hypothetical protein